MFQSAPTRSWLCTVQDVACRFAVNEVFGERVTYGRSHEVANRTRNEGHLGQAAVRGAAAAGMSEVIRIGTQILWWLSSLVC